MKSVPFAVIVLIASLEAARAQGTSQVPGASANRPDSSLIAHHAYAPQHAALGWIASGAELLVVHREEYGAHDVRYSGCAETGIYAVPMEGGESRVVTRGSRVCAALQSDRGGVALHPQRDRIAYVPVNQSGLFVLDLSSADLEQLATPCDSAWGVQEAGSWSPRGDRIAVILGCDHPEARGRLFLISAAGQAPRRVAGATRLGEAEPAWAPDGHRLAFTQVRDIDDGGTDAIAIMDTLGRERRVLANGWGPTWSPDGEWIAFLRQERVGDERVNTIRVIRPDGREEHELFRSRETTTMSRGWGPFLEGQPWGPLLWSPDSRWLLFGRTFNTASTIWRVRFADGHLDQVTTRREPPARTPHGAVDQLPSQQNPYPLNDIAVTLSSGTVVRIRSIVVFRGQSSTRLTVYVKTPTPSTERDRLALEAKEIAGLQGASASSANATSISVIVCRTRGCLEMREASEEMFSFVRGPDGSWQSEKRPGST